MNKLQRFQPKLITKHFFPNQSPAQINTGECFIWALTAHHVFTGVQLWHHDSHAFIKYNNLFYDSEKIIGEPDWQDLPAIWSGYRTAFKMSLPQFKHEWRSQPARFNTNWEQIEKRAKTFLSKGRI